ncbi:hypothetical protein M3J09_002829 [Ascochyta lentis]
MASFFKPCFSCLALFDSLSKACFVDLTRRPKHCTTLVFLPLLQIQWLALLLMLLLRLYSLFEASILVLKE